MKRWDSLSVKGNLDTPFIMAVLSKGQGGTAKGCRDSKIRVQSPSISVGLKQPSCLLTSFQHCCFSAALLLFGQVWKRTRKSSWISSIQRPSPSSTQARWHHGPTTPTSQTRTRTKWWGFKLLFQINAEKKEKQIPKKTQKNTKTDIVRVGIRCVCFYVHQSAAGKRWSDFYANKSKEAEKFDISNVTNTEIKLQLISLQDKGSSVLPADKAEKVAHRFGFCSNYELQYVSQNEKNLHINFTI